MEALSCSTKLLRVHCERVPSIFAVSISTEVFFDLSMSGSTTGEEVHPIHLSLSIIGRGRHATLRLQQEPTEVHTGHTGRQATPSCTQARREPNGVATTPISVLKCSPVLGRFVAKNACLCARVAITAFGIQCTNCYKKSRAKTARELPKDP